MSVASPGREFDEVADTAYLERSNPWTFGRRRAKRLMDLCVGVPLVVATAPLIGALAIALAIQHRASPLFLHRRIGEGGSLIMVPKLRTLSPGTPRYADKTVIDLIPPTRLASFLRRSHLDELPQLWLVITGTLSLVGPRPRMLSEAVEHGDADFELVRTSIPQGCTGLWQIGSGSGGRVSDHPEYDRAYVEAQSVLFDLWVVTRTIVNLFGARPVDIHEPAVRRRVRSARTADA